jgi:hypothetical protein
VGGIVAGVAAVLIIGGIWFWCHRKAEKEKEVSLVFSWSSSKAHVQIY